MKGDFQFSFPELDNELEAMKVLDLIVAEFESDPMSVQCFDLRTVERAKKVIRDRKQFERAGKVPPLLTGKDAAHCASAIDGA